MTIVEYKKSVELSEWRKILLILSFARPPSISTFSAPFAPQVRAIFLFVKLCFHGPGLCLHLALIQPFKRLDLCKRGDGGGENMKVINVSVCTDMYVCACDKSSMLARKDGRNLHQHTHKRKKERGGGEGKSPGESNSACLHETTAGVYICAHIFSLRACRLSAPPTIFRLMSKRIPTTAGSASDPEPVAGVQTMIAKALFERAPELLPVVSIKLYKDQEQSSQKKPQAEQVWKRGMVTKRGCVFVYLYVCVCVCVCVRARVCMCAYRLWCRLPYI